MRILFSVIILVSTFCLNAQIVPVFKWANTMGDSEFDDGRGIVLDKSGNIYMVGSFMKTVDFDPSNGNYFLNSLYNSQDIFISKYNANGNLIWAKQMGGFYFNYGNAITLDEQGNIYTIGYYTGISDFDPGKDVYNLKGRDGMFISKLDSAGNFIWARSMGTGIYGYSIITDSLQNVYTTGNFKDTVDFDPDTINTFNLMARGNPDVFISKLDSNGNFVWAKNMGGKLGGGNGVQIVLDKMSNINVTGQFSGKVDFNPNSDSFNLISNGSGDIFISKFDLLGNLIWAKNIGGNGNDNVKSMVIDGNNNICITGGFTKQVDFDPSAGILNLTAKSDYDIYILKLDTSGSLIWVKQIGKQWDQIDVSSIAIDQKNDIYLSGNLNGNIDFNPGIETCFLKAITLELFELKLSSSGEFGWAINLGKGGNFGYSSLKVDGLGNSYITGSFAYNADFDPTSKELVLSSEGKSDIFICKLSQELCMLKNTVTRKGITLTSDDSVSNYQWIDCLTKLPIPGETNRSFNPSKIGIYGVIVSNSICSDTSLCVELVTLALNTNSVLETLSISPNPTNGIINYRITKFNENGTIELYNSQGLLVYSETNISDSGSINITDKPNGLYVIKYSNLMNEIGIQKIVKF